VALWASIFTLKSCAVVGFVADVDVCVDCVPEVLSQTQ
jgi:hypothetical protein